MTTMDAVRRMYSRSSVGLLVLLCALPRGSTIASAQSAPPIHGVSGTVATDATIDSERKAAGAVARGAADAARKLSPGGDGTALRPLDALAEGSRVVVQEMKSTSPLASRAEGVVIDVNRPRLQITVRFADKQTQTLRVLDRTGATQGAHVVVSLADQSGETIGYDFSQVP
jgi:hypothetical protein